MPMRRKPEGMETGTGLAKCRKAHLQAISQRDVGPRCMVGSSVTQVFPGSGDLHHRP